MSFWITVTSLRKIVQAAAQAPAIIFLDELDGLVPARSQASSGSDQIYASVVSTMLALMDGVADRGAVIVIGATNRCAILFSHAHVRNDMQDWYCWVLILRDHPLTWLVDGALLPCYIGQRQ